MERKRRGKIAGKENGEAVGKLKSMDYCFACGKDNPHGLRLSIHYKEGKVVSHFQPSLHHQGWEGIIHGGLLATLLDEVMVYAAYFEGEKTVTAELVVRFRKPVNIGERLRIVGWIEKRFSRLFICRSQVMDAEGRIVAEGKGKLLRI